MKTKSKPTEAEVKTCIANMRAMKEAERGGGVEIFTDNLMRATVVVKAYGVLWLCPKCQGGWARRQRLHLSPLVELERLTPAAGISPEWLGVPRLDAGEGQRTDAEFHPRNKKRRVGRS